ncbi:DUF3137 domain-containing protein [Xanthomarina gelatinilytica]|uniref:DUF3137 domain-containing protein n=1 Tax=Xanthomarina gelatinilytica TaxID=1137281 RepID=UPI003AA83CF7
MDEDLRSFLKERAVQLEIQRTKALKMYYFYRIAKPLRTLLKGILILLFPVTFILPFLLPITIFVGVLFLALLVFNNPQEVYESNLKNDVLPTIFNKIRPNFTYSAKGYNNLALEESEILDKGFFANTIEIQGEDFVRGTIENIDVEFCEIKFLKEKTNYGKTAGGCFLSILLIPIELVRNLVNRNARPNEIFFGFIQDVDVYFSGFFMYADFHKEFDGRVLMMPKKNDKFKDRVNEIFQQKSLIKMSIENPYIDNNYNIYTTNSQTGYYVLSQSLIDKIHIVIEKEKALPIISFIQGKMYFLIPWDKNLFKADIFTKVEDERYFLRYIDEIESFEKIVRGLNLDVRIWSKT